jgi:hypothetical protein
MEQNPLVLFLLNRFNVKDISEIDPFGTNYVASHEPAREVSINVELHGAGQLCVKPEQGKQPRAPFKDSVYNLEDVSVHTSYIRYAKNPQDSHVMVCKLYEPVFAEEQATEAERAQIAMGGIARLAMNVAPRFEGATNCFLIKENPACIFLNPAFIKTFMHLDETNLMNGIIRLSPELCAQAGLPREGEIFDEKGEGVDITVDYYVLVPYHHVLAWCLRIGDHWRRLKGLWAIEMVVKRSGESLSSILYYIVGNQTFDKIRASCVKNFMTRKIDRRRLTDVGIMCVSKTDAPSFVVSMTYVCYPHLTPEIKATLMPKLPDNFPEIQIK